MSASCPSSARPNYENPSSSLPLPITSSSSSSFSTPSSPSAIAHSSRRNYVDLQNVMHMHMHMRPLSADNANKEKLSMADDSNVINMSKSVGTGSDSRIHSSVPLAAFPFHLQKNHIPRILTFVLLFFCCGMLVMTYFSLWNYYAEWSAEINTVQQLHRRQQQHKQQHTQHQPHNMHNKDFHDEQTQHAINLFPSAFERPNSSAAGSPTLLRAKPVAASASPFHTSLTPVVGSGLASEPLNSSQKNASIKTRAQDDDSHPHINASEVAIMIVADLDNLERYSEHWMSLRCYCARHGYDCVAETRSAQDKSISYCRNYKIFYFRKHCLVALYLEQHPNIRAALVLDGDSFVVNANVSLDKYLNLLSNEVHILHYERFHNGEIAAGNYLVQNSPIAQAHLREWADFESKVPAGGMTNQDNGALHALILSKLLNDDTSQLPYQTCIRLWGAGHSLESYDKWVGCVRCVLGGHRLIPHSGILIVRKAHFAVRDFFVSSDPYLNDNDPNANIGMVAPSDILFHGWKSPPLQWWTDRINQSACFAKSSQWTPRLKAEVSGSAAQTRALIMQREKFTVNDRSFSVALADVGECWPNCPLELNEEEDRQVRIRLCPVQLREFFLPS